jgi:autophagy-related protein 9
MKNNPAEFGERTWSTEYTWNFREFNELPHEFEKRMKLSQSISVDYLNQFPNYFLSILSSTFMFIISTISSFIIILSLFKYKILFEVEVFEQNLFWWLTIFLVIWTMLNSIKIDKNAVFTPKESIDKLKNIIKEIPKNWIDDPTSENTINDFKKGFSYSITQFLFEVYSIFFIPFVLFFSVYNSAPKLLDFINKNIDKNEFEGNDFLKSDIHPDSFNKSINIEKIEKQSILEFDIVDSNV